MYFWRWNINKEFWVSKQKQKSQYLLVKYFIIQQICGWFLSEEIEVKGDFEESFKIKIEVEEGEIWKSLYG